MQQYNKLVRDKIPKIIEDSGKSATIRILSDSEYVNALETKLDEEVGEYHRDKSVEELADILEVIYALAATCGCSRAQLEQVYLEKHCKRGGFTQKICLTSVE